MAIAGAAGLVAPANAAEPADDHAGGAAAVTNFFITGAIERPGDRDWYAITLSGHEGPISVRAKRGAGVCSANALRITVLNPEAHAIRWDTVGAEGGGVRLPTGKPGRYLIEVDAGGEPTCGGLGYEFEFRPVAGSGAGSDAKCGAARGRLAEDLGFRRESRKYAKSPVPATAKRHSARLLKLVGFLKQDRKNVKKYC